MAKKTGKPNFHALAEEYEQLIAHNLSKRMGFPFETRVTMKGLSTKHQFDLVGKTNIGGLKFLIVGECKLYRTSPIKKEQMAAFAHRISDVAAQKGIFICSSGYQKGAIQIAEAHNISLAVCQLVQIETIKPKPLTKIKNKEYPNQEIPLGLNLGPLTIVHPYMPMGADFRIFYFDGYELDWRPDGFIPWNPKWSKSSLNDFSLFSNKYQPPKVRCFADFNGKNFTVAYGEDWYYKYTFDKFVSEIRSKLLDSAHP